MKKLKKSKKKAKILLSIVLIFSFSNLFCFNSAYLGKSEVKYSKAECVMDMESRRILYAQNAETRLPMASTTKIVTAITVLEHCKDIETPFKIPELAIGVEGSSIYLKEEDNYSVKDLLYGLMLRSGNDAATALAIKTAGSKEKFSVLMNKTAQKAGALNSNFLNPHGLPQKGHLTTARDLTLITCYAMHNTLFREIVNTRYYQPRNWVNKNKLLKQYEYAVGVKTGYTKEAGRCLVSAATKDNMTLICSVLSCGDMYNRSQNLFEDCFQNYKREQIISKNDIFELQTKDGFVKSKAEIDFFYPLLEGEREHLEIVTSTIKDEKNDKNFKKNEEIIGQIQIYLLKRLIFSGNLYKL